jgi:hypothetical protein
MPRERQELERAARVLRAQDRQWALLRARLDPAELNGAGTTMAATHPLDEACRGDAPASMCGLRPSVVSAVN